LELATRLASCLGGGPNIVALEPCAHRLRARVADPGLVDVPGLKALGACGVVLSGQIVQVVIGQEAEDLARALECLPGQLAESAALAS
jgi:PTS system N-acetylglucosamine-specific IIB component